MKKLRKERQKRRLYAFLRRYGPCTAKQIAQVFERNEDTVKAWLSDMQWEGKVYMVGLGGQEWEYEART